MSDLIRREDVLRLAESGKLLSGSYGERAKDVIKAIPSAEPKVGKWIIRSETETLNELYTCDQCGYIQWFPKVRAFDDPKRVLNYCPNCGAKME